MQRFNIDKVWLNGEWQSDLVIEVDDSGVISGVSGIQDSGASAINLRGPVIPGFINSHSHAFQYAMAGLTEVFTSDFDDFWTWRETMYSIAQKLNPEQLESVAAMLYSEMLRNGYTHVAEFHYLHHQPGGTNYEMPAEMGRRLIAAAKETGINITLIPIYYRNGGFGKEPASNQMRFISADPDKYESLLADTRKGIEQLEFGNLGIGAHSIRAVDSKDLKFLKTLYDGPFHIHISEQIPEVQECIDYHGKRPLQWLSEQIEFDSNTNLVHATHLDDAELRLLISSDAHAVLCPSTEGNLGDGFFRFSEFSSGNGNYSIGSDSHIGLSPMEELRWLDYQQRLSNNRRDTMKGRAGDQLFAKVLGSGQSAVGLKTELEPGNPFNALVLDANHPLINECNESNILNTLIYSGDSTMIAQVYAHGKLRVQDGKHVNSEAYREKMAGLVKSLQLR